METRLGQKSGQLQLSSVNLAGSGLRPVTRSSAMAESTFDARVFLLGSGSTSLAWAGGAKPVDIGGLLAQPASKPAEPTSTQRKIAKRRITSTARSSMPQPPRFPPAMAAAPWPWPNLTHRKLAGKRKKHALAVAHHGGAPRTSSTGARKKCRTLPSVHLGLSAQQIPRAGGLEKAAINARAPRQRSRRGVRSAARFTRRALRWLFAHH